MGAMVKSGTRPIRGVLKIAQAPKKPGLYLLDTTPDEKLEPAHHEVADPSDMLDLTACGRPYCVFVTGRGQVVGTPVSPVIKVTGNPRTYGRMKDDIDFCAAPALTGDRSLDDLSDDLLELVSRVAPGRTHQRRTPGPSGRNFVLQLPGSGKGSLRMAFLRRMPVLFLKFFWLSCFFAIDRPKNHSRPCPETWAKAGNFYQDPPCLI